MQYKCNSCGHIFDEDEIYYSKESRGEFWGAPAYETVACCPNCMDCDFDEYDEEDEERCGKYTVIAVGGIYDGQVLDTFDTLAEAIEEARSKQDRYELGCAIFNDENEEVDWE